MQPTCFIFLFNSNIVSVLLTELIGSPDERWISSMRTGSSVNPLSNTCSSGSSSSAVTNDSCSGTFANAFDIFNEGRGFFAVSATTTRFNSSSISGDPHHQFGTFFNHPVGEIAGRKENTSRYAEHFSVLLQGVVDRMTGATTFGCFNHH